ncbi:TPA: hypothetical protein NH788_000233 [Pseudomonas aeruginosa]|uniref:hypothetical protein n=1 Tax=Pseudomonas aeruginosa TaxID=287 RepID=UPI00053D8774|nr:hypothetical protein [Pseudomonas aeruginosa]ELC8323541.1 hypothetical protein [Pseudomonas aeruginosa]MBF2899833.1 hypothetical protein [Pseudomonas aeruginosa]MBF3039249.1 hypothetical protein [Pseudomonas aeruginosa]MBF3208518.1 hypothetical protein [Pseudomonas aeruginosa]HCE7250052.1 hypothetical protein [Pseudomonas aeruginosa]
MTIYTSIRSAVVSALAAETIDNTAKQAWQKLYQPGYADSEGLAGLIRGSNTSGIKRIDADCWVHARLHSQLKPRHWNALVAKYSTHREKKKAAIEALIPLIATPAPRRFLGMAVYTWAIPKLKGVEGKRSTDMIILDAVFYDMNNWESEGRPEQTRRRWRSGIHSVLNEMLKEAELDAGEILMEEGIIVGEAA